MCTYQGSQFSDDVMLCFCSSTEVAHLRGDDASSLLLPPQIGLTWPIAAISPRRAPILLSPLVLFEIDT